MPLDGVGSPLKAVSTVMESSPGPLIRRIWLKTRGKVRYGAPVGAAWSNTSTLLPEPSTRTYHDVPVTDGLIMMLPLSVVAGSDPSFIWVLLTSTGVTPTDALGSTVKSKPAKCPLACA